MLFVSTVGLRVEAPGTERYLGQGVGAWGESPGHYLISKHFQLGHAAKAFLLVGSLLKEDFRTRGHMHLAFMFWLGLD